MFYPCSEAPLFSEAGLQGLWISLNTPVLDIDELPVGPATAAVVLYSADYAELQLAVALRSVESGQVAVFAYRGKLEGERSPQRALDLAQGFTGSMGFLFDDEPLGSRVGEGCTRAMQSWNGVVAGSGPVDSFDPVEFAAVEHPSSERSLPPPTPLLDEDPASELILDDLLEQDLLPAPAAGSRPSLTKFRESEPAPDAAAQTSARGSQLGRIPLRRVRKSADGSARPGLLTRLLTSF